MMPPGESAGNLTGSLLVAHPSLTDPNFRRTILFLSHHSPEEGAVGFVLNRPTGQTLGEVVAQPVDEDLQTVKLHYGGPVGQDEVTLVSLQWSESPSSVSFQSFSTSFEQAENLALDNENLLAFIGYAGWSKGQLEREIAQNAWLVVQPTKNLVHIEDPETIWHDVMQSYGPLLRLLAKAPDRPDLN